jgi:dinuclear metal center YbgI/SA1388 family protein
MTTLADLLTELERIAPLSLAESWDNVGLLLGDVEAKCERVMTCLTVTSATVDEAIERQASAVVSHHPILFKPVQKITTATPEGRIVWRLARAGIAVLSAHTAYDSAASGINQQIAERLGLLNIAPLSANTLGEEAADVGTGRCGDLPSPEPLDTFVSRLKACFSLGEIDCAGPTEGRVQRVGIGCGSAASFLALAQRHACDTFVTGEARFHDLLAAEERGMRLILLGHFASERFALDHLAKDLAARLPDVQFWASQRESDPLRRS